MNDERKCPECGLPLPDGVAEGLCMHCLLGAGVSDTVTQLHTGTDVPPAGRAQSALLPDFGPYHTIGVLGEGGMGIVYLAEQREPVRRRVALKVLKSADLGSSVLARFESESQALALMDHPNIARIYDAGTTSSGRPYFAMEYVPGIPITDYCDRNLLGFQGRLALFQQVCQAVHHAHQKGIIHRDIKPSNVLIMLQDGKPVPKVIDFGVAKALNQRLVEKTLFTEIGMLIGTPEYMSPEQADLTGLDIDSTTDIYSLGVLLYELLVGALPFDSKTLRKAGYAEIQRIIRETEPPKLSTRLSSMGDEAAQEVARQRHSDVSGMARLLRGDLEWITMKALEKDRTRRYASASEFAADIGRHLASEPVMAGAPDLAYRIGKFVRRNKVLVAAGSAVAAALLIGGIVSFASYVREAREHERAESESYAANLSAADMQLRAGQVHDARLRLASIPAASRGWEWRYLIARTDESLATVYSRVNEPVRLGLNEDGSQIFHYSHYFLRSWDTTTKRLVADAAGLGWLAAVGAHGKTILVDPPRADDAEAPLGGFVLQLYDVSTRRLLSELGGMTESAGASAISDDGTLVASAPARFYGKGTDQLPEPAPITVWDTHSSRIVARLEGHADTVWTLKFSPNGKLLASPAVDGTIGIWDMAMHRRVATLQHPGGAFYVAFSKDSRMFAAGGIDGRVQVWNPATGALLRSWQASPRAINAVAFSPDGALLATCSGESVRVWQTATGALRNEFNGVLAAWQVEFHPTAPRLYSAGAGAIKEWDLNRNVDARDDTDEVYASMAAFSPDGKYVASGSWDGWIRIYDGTSGSIVRSWKGAKDAVLAVAFSPDSTVVASGSGSADKTIKIWRVGDGGLIRTFAGHMDMIWSLAFSPDGSRIVSGSEDRTIRIWDMGSQASANVISTAAPISRVAFSPDGRTILGLRKLDRSILLFDASTRLESGVLSTDTGDADPRSEPRAMALSNDGEVLIGPADSGRALAIWDFPKRRLRQILPVLQGANNIKALAISPDGSRAAIGGTGPNVSVWDLRRGKLLVTLAGHSVEVFSLAWSQDGTRLASFGGRTIHVWDSRSAHNDDAELLLDQMSQRCLLVDEMEKELTANAAIPPELRKAALELARKRGNAPVKELNAAAWQTGLTSGRPRPEYLRALNRATAAIQVPFWTGQAYLTLGLLQLRVGQFEDAIRSTERALDTPAAPGFKNFSFRKSPIPDAHSIRALVYFKLNDQARARSEAALARKSADEFQVKEDYVLLGEAESLIRRERPGLSSHK